MAKQGGSWKSGHRPHEHFHAHPGVEGHDHEHPLVGHHYAPFGKRVYEVEEVGEPPEVIDFTLVRQLKDSIAAVEARKRDA